MKASRIDCFPCIRIPPRIALSDGHGGSGLGRISQFIRRYYAPLLLKPFVKGVVLLAFAGVFVASVISMQHIELGFGKSFRSLRPSRSYNISQNDLDQRLALPSDSYLVPYFDSVDAYLDVGPPVYFVAHNI